MGGRTGATLEEAPATLTRESTGPKVQLVNLSSLARECGEICIARRRKGPHGFDQGLTVSVTSKATGLHAVMFDRTRLNLRKAYSKLTFFFVVEAGFCFFFSFFMVVLFHSQRRNRREKPSFLRAVYAPFHRVFTARSTSKRERKKKIG